MRLTNGNKKVDGPVRGVSIGPDSRYLHAALQVKLLALSFGAQTVKIMYSTLPKRIYFFAH